MVVKAEYDLYFYRDDNKKLEMDFSLFLNILVEKAFKR